MLRALIFDVDGTLAETEEAHRQAFNLVFAQAGLDWIWDVDRYRDLLRTTGGKERISRYLKEEGLELPPERIGELHRAKNTAYAGIVRGGGAALRPGIADLIEDTRLAGLQLALCTTTSRDNVEALIDVALGRERRALFATMVTGEDVAAKKPAPDAYCLTLARLGLPAESCVALEDSRNGVESARAAGVRVVVSPSLYTAHESFAGAHAVHRDWREFNWREFDW